MKSKIILIVAAFFIFQYGFSQKIIAYKTWNPASDSLQVLEGQGWPGQIGSYYGRLPVKAKSMVRKEVWNLSENSAGLQFRFRTNANEIIVKYIVTGGFQFPHMPATGVSGIDLYAKNSDGKWFWCAGKYSFGDTITYHFNNLLSKDGYGNPFEFTLYLPLYNTVRWMEVAVPEKSKFVPLKARKEKPIVVYGTSIAQGACASRPGLAWANILSRKLDRPVVNLSFSGNGRLEKEVVDLILEIDAKLYVLDCLPNLTTPGFSKEEINKRITESVIQLHEQKPYTPILLTEHDGYADEGINPVRKKEYQDPNDALNEVFDSLSVIGLKNMYELHKSDIGQDIETTVDGTHPNDIGMYRYADAYEKKIREIFQEPIGALSTMIPVTQRRDAAIYDWEKRHEQVLKYNKANSPNLFMIGNSITHYWAGNPKAPISRGVDSWNKFFGSKNVANLGFGWDRIENVLWRVYHGELDSILAKQIVLMIGTNNLQFNTDEEIAEGIQFLIKAIQIKQPNATILLMGILPRRSMEERVIKINKLLSKLKFNSKIKFADVGPLFLQEDKKIDENLFADGLHPNEIGYNKLGAFIEKRVAF